MRIYIALVLVVCFSNRISSQESHPYKNPKFNSHERALDLLSRMTPEEKVGQLLCPLGWEMYKITDDDVQPSDAFAQLIKERPIGMLWATYRADPWTKKTLLNGLNPELAAKAGNALQRYVIENTRLGIPIFLAEEAPHGHMAIGATVFPTGIGMAATWAPALIRKVGETIGGEIRSQGGHISYGPVLDLSRDPRWSRVEETFGEDPVLGGVMGAAMVEGLGRGDLSKPYSTIATLKHFLAYGVPEGGQNGNPTFAGIRELHENFLPPFKKAIEAGALSVMTSYNSMDGVPCTSNSYLLTDILRNNWKFRGFVVSDLYSIEGIHQSHFVARTLGDAAIQAAEAGVDVDLGGDAFVELLRALKEKRMSEAVVDSAVCRVLRLKFEMGLFENPFVDPAVAAKSVGSKAHTELAREVARASITLLENKNDILPLSEKIRKVAVIGPNADNRYNMLGDYTAPQEDSAVKTVLDGIRDRLGDDKVTYVKGCAVRDTSAHNIAEAVKAAKQADVVIVAVGGSSARDFETSYQETGAAIADKRKVSDMECGEGFDRATLSLLGRQDELLRALKATGKPLVVVYIEGRPLEKNWAAEHADALLTAYYPGQEGGNAIADVLFGDYNPAGRLPLSVPVHAGQIPVYYNKKNPKGHDYVEIQVDPMYAFGYGLSYTTFDYSNLLVKQLAADRFEVSFDITNTGKYDGDEVAQLYLRNMYASVVQPVRQLKHFERIFLKRGDSKRVFFVLTSDDFSIVGRDMQRVVESGDFSIMIGSSSDRIRLQKEITIDYRQGIVTDEFVYEEASFPSVHSATIEETPAGLVAAFFGGEYEGHPDVGIYVSRQTDRGWTDPVKVAEGLTKGACYNPVLYRTPDGELMLFYKIGKNVQDWSGHLIRSYDNGITWTKPKALPAGFLGPVKNRPLYVGNTLICGSSTENDGWKVHFEFTRDKGKTWTKSSPINDAAWSIIQPALLVHKDGRLQMVCRSRNEAVVSAYSSDNGKTWTKPFALQVPNNNSGIDAITLHDGRFLMVCNNIKASQSAYQPRKRTPLSVLLSEDGIHWKTVLIPEDSPIGEYSYPSVMQGADGMIHVVYTWRREKIRYIKIDPRQLTTR